MASSVLNLHSGGSEVSYDSLQRISAPDPTRTWVPIKHASVLDTAVGTLQEAGYRIVQKRLAVSHEGHRFFGTLDLNTELTNDGSVTLAVGLRNSTDMSFPMGFIAGSRVFVCSNLAFRADLLVKRKHTLHGAARFSADIAKAVMNLESFKDTEAKRIELLQQREISRDEAHSLILRSCMERGIIGFRNLATVYKEWHEPRHPQFEARTAWSLLNAFTAALHSLQERNPADLARRTMRLQSLLTADTSLSLPATLPA